MKSIGGNTEAVLQKKTISKNAIGAKVEAWEDVQLLNGWLDYTGGDGSYKPSYKGDAEETTHIFMCDYAAIDMKPTLCRLVINKKTYDVLLIDDPMDLHYQLEFYLKFSEVVQ